MEVIVFDRPHWICDSCRFDMPDPDTGRGAALYNRPSGRRHYPQPLIVCGEACASLAETRLVAGEIARMSWAVYVQALTTAAS
jgi:hypothetical protein